jgi:phage terminase large subunit
LGSATVSDRTQLEISPRSLFSRNARQWEAWLATCQKRFVLYGGAAGGGKSFFLRWFLVFYLIALYEQGIKGARVMLACEDYPSLIDRQLSKIQVEFPSSLGTLVRGATIDFQMAEKYGSGSILLRNLDDPAKYLSAEFAGIAVDELTRNKLSVFDFLRSRLRWPGVPRPRFVAGTNPSGIGHSWVKKYWVDDPPELPPELKPLANEFAFVPAKCSDNPFLSAEYHADLETLPPDMAKAYAEGSWDVFAGQYFDMRLADMVDREEEWQIKPWWPKWISVDWGFEHPSAVYWHAMDENQRTVTYREFVTRTRQNPEKLTPRQLGERIVELTDTTGKNGGVFGPERISDVYLSPDAFASRTGDATIAEQLGDVLVAAGIPRPSQADNDRVGGWMLMYQMLVGGYWRIGSGCSQLIKCLPSLVRDAPEHVEDVAKSDGDDPADAARYGLKSRHRPGAIPLGERVDRRIASVQKGREAVGLPPQTDPTSIALMTRVAVSKERKRDKPVPLISKGRFQRYRITHP